MTPLVGRSGGILVCWDSNKIRVISHFLHRFCVDLIVENKLDNVQWQLTVVYGPVLRHYKQEFWDELNFIRNGNLDVWFLCGDFNAIRKKEKKSGPNFDMHLSRQFNNFINDNRLLELKLTTRKYTWSNGTKFALLDRILVSITWDHLYPSSHLSDLSSTGSDHCPLLVQTNTTIPISKPIFRFDPLWI